MKKWMILLLLILVTGLVTAATADETIAVRVGDMTYTTEEVQEYIDIMAMNIQYSLGKTVSQIYPDGEHEAFLEDVAEHFITKGIVESKAHELGLDQLSKNETEELRYIAQENYEQLWQMFSEQLKQQSDIADTDLERVVTQVMNEAGYSLDAMLNDVQLLLKENRLIEKFCGEIEVTDEEVRAFYEENYLNPAKEKYENNVPLFEQEVLLQAGTTAYAPEGYFYIKYILLNPSEEVSRPVEDAEWALMELEEKANQAQADLNTAALDESADLEAARKTYAEIGKQITEAQSALDAAKKTAETGYVPLAEIVRAAMSDGVSFESLMAQYSTVSDMNGEDQPGYPFHPDSTLWDKRLSEQVKKLEKQGDVTDPVYAVGGIYLVCRMGDMQCGAYEPDADTLDQLKENLLQERQNAALDELVAEWRDGYEIETDTSGLIFPIN